MIVATRKELERLGRPGGICLPRLAGTIKDNAILDEAPLILTLALDDRSQAFFDRQRERWFPPKLNVIRAHITMFHHLPGDRLDAVTDDLRMLCTGRGLSDVTVTGLRSLGRGVAYTLSAPEIEALRSLIATRWRTQLTAQDRQPWHPHVTVQNKVSPAEARSLMALLGLEFTPFTATAAGVAVWRYCGGPWQSLGMVPFGAVP